MHQENHAIFQFEMAEVTKTLVLQWDSNPGPLDHEAKALPRSYNECLKILLISLT